MKNDLPIYDIVLSDENQGVAFISLVDVPAIGVDWIKLSKTEKECKDCEKQELAEGDACWEGYVQVGTKIVDGREVPNCVPVVDGEPKPQKKNLTSQRYISFKTDKDRQLLYGPFLIPNMLIYRFDEKMGEYYVRFSKEQIEKIATKFNEDLNNKNINFMHTEAKVEAFVAENWIIDGEQDKSKNLLFDLPEGTWFGAVKVKDADFWKDKVKSDEVKGFSVEILADLELALKNNEKQMKKQIKLGSALLQDGTTTIYWDGESLAVGVAVFVDEAMTQPAPDGIHMTQDGDTIRVTEGKVEIYAPGLEFAASLADYPWDKCMEDQMKQYGDKDIAEAVCGKIKAENMAEAPAAPATATTSAPLSSEEVSAMIDARFADLMDEISKLKTLVSEKDENMAKYRKEIEEKFSMTPATGSIKKAEAKIDDKFSKIEARIRDFAKNK